MFRKHKGVVFLYCMTTKHNKFPSFSGNYLVQNVLNVWKMLSLTFRTWSWAIYKDLFQYEHYFAHISVSIQRDMTIMAWLSHEQKNTSLVPSFIMKRLIKMGASNSYQYNSDLFGISTNYCHHKCHVTEKWKMTHDW